MFQENMIYNRTVTMVTISCCSCGVIFGMPSDLNDCYQADSDKWFYCPNGHKQHYSKSTEEKLREEIRAKANAITRKDNEIAELQNSLTKTSRKLNRTEKRIANGVCPCCNRTFKDLAAHMQTKHPEFKK